MKLRPLRDPAETELPKLADDPRYKAVANELAALETRFDQAKRREDVAKARRRGQQPTRSIAARAKDLLAGGTIIGSSPESELEAAFEEQLVLRKAIDKTREALERIAGEISFDVCKQFASLNAEALRNALEAATGLHEALEVTRVIRARLIAAGYQPNEAALPTHWFPAGAALGDPARVGMTPAAIFKQWLIERGILK
jgi:hypothetical protein